MIYRDIARTKTAAMSLYLKNVKKKIDMSKNFVLYLKMHYYGKLCRDSLHIAIYKALFQFQGECKGNPQPVKDSNDSGFCKLTRLS